MKKTDWNPFLKAEFDKPYWDKLQQFIFHERQTRAVYPPHDEVFSAFHLTSWDNLKVVILGQDPYHGPGQAHGLAFSVKEPTKPPPSLVNIYKELKVDLGIEPANHGCLEAWAKRGVLLLNTTMTVRANQPASHQNQGWEIFTDEVLAAINQSHDAVVFILWGASARKKKKIICGIMVWALYIYLL